MSEPITVLLVDDHALVRQGVRAFLQTQGDISVVAEAESGEEAVRLAAEHAPDVALMDLIMPGMDGVEATRRLVASSPRTNVVMLTSYHDDEHIFPAIRAGALSYVLKEIGPDELAEAVRKAADGEAVLHPRVAARVVRELHGARRRLYRRHERDAVELRGRIDLPHSPASGKSFSLRVELRTRVGDVYHLVGPQALEGL